jgi:hypothetical protein
LLESQVKEKYKILSKIKEYGYMHNHDRDNLLNQIYDLAYNQGNKDCLKNLKKRKLIY